jgi:hypothetical protein
MVFPGAKTMLSGPNGSFQFEWQSPLRWRIQEDNRVVLINRWVLPTSSNLIGKPVSSLGNATQLSVSVITLGLSSLFDGTYEDVVIQVNGKEYWHSSAAVYMDLRKDRGFIIPIPGGLKTHMNP